MRERHIIGNLFLGKSLQKKKTLKLLTLAQLGEKELEKLKKLFKPPFEIRTTSNSWVIHQFYREVPIDHFL